VVSFGVRLSLTFPGVVAVLVAGGLPPASVEQFSVITIFTNLPYFALGLVLFQLHQVLTAANADLHDVGASFVFFAVSGLLCVVYLPQERLGADFASLVPLRHMAGFLFVLLVLGLAFCRVRGKRWARIEKNRFSAIDTAAERFQLFSAAIADERAYALPAHRTTPMAVMLK